MAENKRLPPGKTADLEREHETHRTTVNLQADDETRGGDIQTAFEYENAVEAVSEIAKGLDAVNGEGNAIAAAAPGQVPVEDPTGPTTSASSRPDTAQQGDLGLQLNQLAGNIAANLAGLKATGDLMKSATRQLSSGIQQFKTGMKGMKKSLSNFKVEDK